MALSHIVFVGGIRENHWESWLVNPQDHPRTFPQDLTDRLQHRLLFTWIQQTIWGWKPYLFQPLDPMMCHNFPEKNGLKKCVLQTKVLATAVKDMGK